MAGDANSPYFPNTLPIRQARWIISALPDVDTNLVLTAALRRHGTTCPIAVTAHADANAELYRAVLCDGTMSTVFRPFREAAASALATLRALEGSERDCP